MQTRKIDHDQASHSPPPQHPPGQLPEMTRMQSANKPSSLVFLEVTHPTVPRGKDAQRLIRSHVTRVQHQKRRESYRADQSVQVPQLVKSATESTLSSKDRQAPGDDRSPSKSLSEPASPAYPPSEDSSSSGLPFFNSSHPSQIKNSKVRKLVRSHVTKWQHASRKQRRKEAAEAADLSESPLDAALVAPVSDVALPLLPANASEKLISKGAAAIRNVILDDSSNTVATAITRLGLDLRSIMAHYYYMALDVHAPEFEAQYVHRRLSSSLARIPRRTNDPGAVSYSMPGVCQRVFLPFLFTDPALTCAIVLIAIIHRMSLMGLRHPPPEVLHLRGFVILAINNALEDPTRSCSDQLIFAVANLAIFEAVFGSVEVYHVHMQGLSRMLRLRGGLPTLGFDGYLQKVLLWYDSNCASLVGCDPYLADWDSKYLADGMRPDSGNFTCGLEVY